MHLSTLKPTITILLSTLLNLANGAALHRPSTPHLLPRQANSTGWTLSFYGGPNCADPAPIGYASNTGPTNGCASIGHGAGSAVVNDPGFTTNWYRDPGCVTHVEVEILQDYGGAQPHCDTPFGDAAGYWSYYEVVPK